MDRREIQEILKEAETILTEAGIAAELQAVAFSKVVDVLLGAGIEQASPAPGRVTRANGLAATSGGPLASIAARMGLSIEEVEEVFFLDGDQLGIGLPSTRLDPGKAGGTKQLALLVAAGRQAGGFDEEWTASSEIRRWCHEFGRFDSSNYSTTLLELGDVFQFRGSRLQREVKVRRLGFERAAELIRRLISPRSTEVS